MERKRKASHSAWPEFEGHGVLGCIVVGEWLGWEDNLAGARSDSAKPPGA